MNKRTVPCLGENAITVRGGTILKLNEIRGWKWPREYISGDQWLNTINRIGEDKTTSNGGKWTENTISNWQWVRYKHKFQEICKTYVRKEQVQPTSVNLRIWNKSTMQPLGEAILAIWQIQAKDRINSGCQVHSGIVKAYMFAIFENNSGFRTGHQQQQELHSQCKFTK